TITFERDALGRIIKETQDDFVIEHEYERVGNFIHTETIFGGWQAYDGNEAIVRFFQSPNSTKTVRNFVTYYYE
ncbi:MAG: hypothetical protein VSS75_015255, partial [Candidatus Parabeggiatoa sp.]|nr:hypothetical protein [Candidatus Parabeggiatoa sp.]